MTDVPDWGAVVSTGSRLAASGTVPAGGQPSLNVPLAVTDQTLVLLYATSLTASTGISVLGVQSLILYGSPQFGTDTGLAVAVVPVSGLVDQQVALSFDAGTEGDQWWAVVSSDDNWQESPVGYLAVPDLVSARSTGTAGIVCGQGKTQLVAAPAAGTLHQVVSAWVTLQTAATATGSVSIAGATTGWVYGPYLVTASGTAPSTVQWSGPGPLYVSDAIDCVNSSGVSAVAGVVYNTVTVR